MEIFFQAGGAEQKYFCRRCIKMSSLSLFKIRFVSGTTVVGTKRAEKARIFNPLGVTTRMLPPTLKQAPASSRLPAVPAHSMAAQLLAVPALSMPGATPCKSPLPHRACIHVDELTFRVVTHATGAD